LCLFEALSFSRIFNFLSGSSPSIKIIKLA
jgi:hypothetical protein